MSHFAVMVVTKERPTDGVLEQVLQPWHEYECTGVKDQYVKRVDDCHDEVMDEWAAMDDEERKKYPSGVISFAVKQGYDVEDGRIFRYTNPDAKWDWWQLGGRWQGMLLVKPGADDTATGGRGLMGSHYGNGVDTCRVGDLDMEAMKKAAVKLRRRGIEECVDNIMQKLGVTEEEVWEQHREFTKEIVEERKKWKAAKDGGSFYEWLKKCDSPAIRREYDRDENGRGGVGMLLDGMFGAGIPEGVTDVEGYIQSAPAFCTFAVVMDGKWYQRGEMGWWGVVADEDEGWESKFNDLLGSLNPSDYISIVDCHI